MIKQTLRLPRTQKAYERNVKNKSNKKCFLCRAKALKKLKYWKIVANEYPYDLIAKRHNIITSLRHVDEDNLNKDERLELLNIKKNLKSHYDTIFENITNRKSIPDHHHLHIIKYKNLETVQKVMPSHKLHNFERK